MPNPGFSSEGRDPAVDDAAAASDLGGVSLEFETQTTQKPG